MSRKKVSAIILAGGSGKRMNSDIPKQYMLLGDKPVLYYSLQAFDKSTVDEIIVVVGENDRDYLENTLLKQYPVTKPVRLAKGGEERYLSVYNGLQEIGGADYVLIHDGARPFLSVEIIENTIQCLEEHPACAVGVPVKDTIKIVDTTGTIKETPDRSLVWAVQTPQAFSGALIREAYGLLLSENGEKGKSLKNTVTDDAMVVEQTLHYPVKMIMGSYSNIKITTPEDMVLGEAFLNRGK